MYQNFIGIDIGKREFFVNTHGKEKVNSYPNNKQGFASFWSAYCEDLSTGLVVLETTGGYEMALLNYLLELNITVHRAHASKVKSFIRSYGRLGKSDSIDAVELARYAHERHAVLPLYTPYENEELRELVCRRGDLKRMLVQEKNRLQAPTNTLIKDSFKAIIHALMDEIDKLDIDIKRICNKTPDLKNKIEVLKTISGIGDVVSSQLLIAMPELGKINRKQIASLGGLAPHPNESGQKVGYRFVRGGRSYVKPILFMAAMSAARSHSELGAFYKKLVNAGKKKMVALTALMRKILVIANARLREYFEGKSLEEIARA